MINWFLDRLEEVLIASFMALATLITFLTVAMRYLTGSGIDWAQELTIFLFIWMAKFGAAYGVRTGIHIGVDFVVNWVRPSVRYYIIQLALTLGTLFTAAIAFFGMRWVVFIYGTGQLSPDMEIPMWIVYLGVPLGSGLMCYRFLQVQFHFAKTGELPVHQMGEEESYEEKVV